MIPPATENIDHYALGNLYITDHTFIHLKVTNDKIQNQKRSVIFSRKSQKIYHSTWTTNQSPTPKIQPHNEFSMDEEKETWYTVLTQHQKESKKFESMP